MEADDIVIEYIRGKLKGARGKRADAILQPPVAPEAPAGDELPPEDLAQLEALMQSEGGPPMGEPCPECGAAGGCDCPKAM